MDTETSLPLLANSAEIQRWKTDFIATLLSRAKEIEQELADIRASLVMLGAKRQTKRGPGRPKGSRTVKQSAEVVVA